MRSLARTLTSIGLSLVLTVPALLDAGCASHADDRVNVALATLSSSGVGVYESYDMQAPIQAIQGVRSAMRLTRWQLTNMLAQADAGMGMLGADMDRMEGPKAPKHAPTFSFFIAAWIVRDRSPLAHYAQQLMGAKTDYKHAPRVTFPLLVIAMFIADAARLPAGKSSASSKQSFNFERWIAQPAEAAGICSSVASYVTDVIADVTNALTVSSSSNGFFVSLWNTAVAYLAGAVISAVSYVLAPLLKVITAVAAGLAALTTIASTLQAWTVSIEEDPQSVTLGDQPVEGKFTAVVHAPSIDWPEQVKDCAAQLAGVQLDTITYKGAPVTWQTFGEIPAKATVSKKEFVIGDDKRASITYRTSPVFNLPKAECSSPRATGYLGARATVERIDIVHAQQELLKLAFSGLPTFVNNHLMPFFAPWLNSAQTSFANLLASPVTGTGTTEIFELQLDASKCTASPAPSPAPTSSSDVNDTAMVGAWACAVHQTVNTAIGPIAVTVHASYGFNKGGMASGGTSPDAKWSGSNSVSAGNSGAMLGGSGPYTYVPSGSQSGTLHIDGADHQLTWSGSNAWSMAATSSVSHRTYTLQCSRK
jgi:hypothetical protein